LSVVLHDGGRSTISSWWGHGENIGTESPRTSGVRRRAPAPVSAAVIASPVLLAVFPSWPVFTVRPAPGHHPPTR
jgi:hypothetical protein